MLREQRRKQTMSNRTIAGALGHVNLKGQIDAPKPIGLADYINSYRLIVEELASQIDLLSKQLDLVTDYENIGEAEASNEVEQRPEPYKLHHVVQNINESLQSQVDRLKSISSRLII